MPQTSVPLRNPYKAAFLAWLVPGLGHFYQGRIGKGMLYAVCILSLYFLGFAMGEGKIVYWRWVNPLNNPEKFCLLLPRPVLRRPAGAAGADPGDAPATSTSARSSGASWPSRRRT